MFGGYSTCRNMNVKKTLFTFLKIFISLKDGSSLLRQFEHAMLCPQWQTWYFGQKYINIYQRFTLWIALLIKISKISIRTRYMYEASYYGKHCICRIQKGIHGWHHLNMCIGALLNTFSHFDLLQKFRQRFIYNIRKFDGIFTSKWETKLTILLTGSTSI